MQISARVRSDIDHHETDVTTNGRQTRVAIPQRETGPGSSLNGGELLLLALATCYGNDIFREAKTLGIDVTAVDVSVDGEFGDVGEPARRIGYRVQVAARASAAEITALILHTDRVAEVHNTLRQGMDVTLENYVAIPVLD